MNKHRSFRPSDFSFKHFTFRNIGWFLAVSIVISLVFVTTGVLLEMLPGLLRVVLVGVGIALMLAFGLFGPKPRKVDVADLPQPSAQVRAICEDPNRSLAEAVKAYREETGLDLFQAKAALDSYEPAQTTDLS